VKNRKDSTKVGKNPPESVQRRKLERRSLSFGPRRSGTTSEELGRPRGIWPGKSRPPQGDFDDDLRRSGLRDRS